jgi:hypothetical protein
MAPARYEDLVAAYRRRGDRVSGTAERIGATAGRLAYNPCLIGEPGRDVLAVRIESPDSYWRDRSSWDPEVRFFERSAAGWAEIPDAPVFHTAEDPFAVWVTDRSGVRQLVFGTVGLDYRHNPPGIVSRFYAAPGVQDLDQDKPFLEIAGMKDIRLVQLRDGVAVCGRPQGGAAGLGRISLALVDDYTDLSPAVLEKAHIFADQLAPETKIGSNALYDLGDRIGVLGHIAVGAEGSEQRYAAAWWTIDPVAMTATTPEVVALREDFPPGPAKLPVLTDVVFPGSLEFLHGGRARLYCGLSDASIGTVVIPAPGHHTP